MLILISQLSKSCTTFTSKHSILECLILLFLYHPPKVVTFFTATKSLPPLTYKLSAEHKEQW